MDTEEVPPITSQTRPPIISEKKGTLHLKPLAGNVDLDFLQRPEYSKIHTLLFSKGEIESITNIPNTIKHINCTHNKLRSIENFPPSLLTLNVAYNELETINLAPFTKLTRIHANRNKLTKIENFPKSIKEVVVAHNFLTQLDFTHCRKLEILLCDNNHLSSITNLIDPIKELNILNNSSVLKDNIHRFTLQKKDDLPKKEESPPPSKAISLETYLEWKNTYYKKWMDKSKHADKAFVPNCIFCNQPGGTLFEIKERQYRAKCIALSNSKSEKCPMRSGISIPMETGFDFPTEYAHSHLVLQKVKQRIVEEKMMSLFGYSQIDMDGAAGEEEQTKDILRLMEDYKMKNELYQSLSDEYNHRINNEARLQSIQDSTLRINNMIADLNEMIENIPHHDEEARTLAIQNMVKIYTDSFLKERERLHKLRYDVCEMISTDGTEFRLVQSMNKPATLPFTKNGGKELLNYYE